MRNKIIGAVFGALFLLFGASPLWAKEASFELTRAANIQYITLQSADPSVSRVLVSYIWDVPAYTTKKYDSRVTQLHLFLAKYKSPLTPYAKDFVEAADTYGIDWKLVPSITGVESTFGKRIPVNSYNAYGWANGDFRFESWEASIDHVSRVLSQKYYARGLNTPEKIGRVYAPPSTTWAKNVRFFMGKLEATKVEG